MHQTKLGVAPALWTFPHGALACLVQCPIPAVGYLGWFTSGSAAIQQKGQELRCQLVMLGFCRV